MDLGAYVQIDELQPVADANGIDIPRIRGYRLMNEQKKVSEEDIAKFMKHAEIEVVEWLCETDPPFNPSSTILHWDDKSVRLKNRYLKLDPKRKDKKVRLYSKIRWDRIHGKKRKILKFEIKKQNKRIKEQYDVFNKYVGRDDVLYVHSRIGGPNWADYEDKQELMSQPWFLERIDDAYDRTYCDFYAKIDPKTIEERRVDESETI